MNEISILEKSLSFKETV